MFFRRKINGRESEKRGGKKGEREEGKKRKKEGLKIRKKAYYYNTISQIYISARYVFYYFKKILSSFQDFIFLLDCL